MKASIFVAFFMPTHRVKKSRGARMEENQLENLSTKQMIEKYSMKILVGLLIAELCPFEL